VASSWRGPTNAGSGRRPDNACRSRTVGGGQVGWQRMPAENHSKKEHEPNCWLSRQVFFPVHPMPECSPARAHHRPVST